MTTNHKLKESIAVCLIIGILAFVAGAENFNSEMERQRYSVSQEQGVHGASFASQKMRAQSVFRDSVIAERRMMMK